MIIISLYQVEKGGLRILLKIFTHFGHYYYTTTFVVGSEKSVIYFDWELVTIPFLVVWNLPKLNAYKNILSH